MRRGGIRGISDILNIGIILSDSILITADTTLVSIMTRTFIIGTIVARGKDGREDSMVAPPKDPNLGARDPARLVEPRMRDRDIALLEWPRMRDRDPVRLKSPHTRAGDPARLG
jgi:hypothetical protein